MAPIHVHALISELGFGGAETLLVDQAQTAADAGIRLTVGYLKRGDSLASAERLRELGIEPAFVPFRRLARVSDHRAIRQHLATVAPDIVHTHLRTADLVGGLAARAVGLPQVSTLHGFDWDTVDWGASPRARAATALVMSARKRLPQRLIAPSAALERGYLERSGDAREHVVTIHSGTSRTARPGSGPGVRAQLGLAPEDLVVAMVSWLRPLKGHDVAIDAIARLPGARLLVVGDGSEAERLRAHAERVAPATVFAGYRGDVMEVLDAVDVLLQPSRMEGFPISLLEAMVAGVPIVATRVGGMPEIVEDGSTGLLLDPPASAEGVAAAIARLHADAGLRADMARRARERFAAEFTATAWAGRLRAFYEAELERRTAR